MKKPTPKLIEPGKNCSPLDSKLAAKFPLLFANLGDDYWDDGTARVRSTMTVFIEEGLVKVCLNDRESEQSLFRSAERLEEALGALEKALGADNADWREWKKGSRKK